jgi:hypothetical protein
VPVRSLALYLLLVGVLVLGTGCASNNKGKIEGTWQSEGTWLAGWFWEPEGNTLKYKNDKGEIVRARRLEFRDDKTFFYSVIVAKKVEDKIEEEVVQSQQLRGKWSLNSGDLVTLTLEKSLGGRKQHVEKVVIESVESDGKEFKRLTMTDSDTTSLTFTRVHPNQ